MKYALIGCGRVAPNHIVAAEANSLEIAALCDVLPAAAASLKERYPACENAEVYTDYKAMLNRGDIDIAAIATPSGLHAQIAVDCINAGVNVIIEKPVALSIADADRIIEASERTGVRVCACHQNRFNKSIQQIRRAVEGGRFGRIYHATSQIRWSRSREYYEQAPWRGTWEEDGGALMNQCIHNIDLLCWMLGDEPETVMAMTDRAKHPYIEAEDEGFALIRFKNGAYGVLEGTVNVFKTDLEETLCIFGESGTVKAEGSINNIISTWDFADGADDPEQVKREFHENPPNVYGFGHTPLYADFIGAVAENRAPYVDIHSGKRALELVLAIYKSAALGAAVTLPLKESASTDFIKRF